ncbi:hypothetical protein JCM19232_4668 [Vibrio ishigakensis]|uniref:Membrane fusion protein n=1 Tax=Vibrio ishigakensis TaxID=1481914 RepID=A0A0B8P9H4_9VIBR|nr:hypothetical protein JCM19232_4668 [Vibrio ishigakensis]
MSLLRLSPIMLAVALLTGCDSSEAQLAAPEPILSVETHSLVQSDHYQVMREYVGTVRAGQQAQLGFELAGKVSNIMVDVGDRVNQGDALSA